MQSNPRSDDRKHRVCVVIETQEYWDRYIASGALDSVAEEFGCSVVVNSKIVIQNKPNWLNRIEGYEVSSSNIRQEQWLLDLHTVRHRKLSKAFDYRVRRRFPSLRNSAQIWRQKVLQLGRQTVTAVTEAQQPPHPEYALSRLRQLGTFLESVGAGLRLQSRRITAHLLGSTLLYRVVVYPRLMNADYRPEIALLVRESTAEIVIWPSQAHDFVGASVIRACQETSKLSLMLVDNWDNLCSKSVLWTRPDYMGVWGPQTIGHAVKFQNMSESRVFALGTPRYEEYLGKSSAEFKQSERNYILFLGSYLYFDEFRILEMLQTSLDDLARRSSHDLFVLYRPHPDGMFKSLVPSPRLSRVRLCADHDAVRGVGFMARERINTHPPVSKFQMLANSRFVVGGLTSMLIEAGLVARRYIALVHREQANPTSPHRVFRSYPHFDGIGDLAHVTFCEDLQTLSGLVTDLSDVYEVPEAGRFLSTYITTGPLSYSFRLRSALDKILTGVDF